MQFKVCFMAIFCELQPDQHVLKRFSKILRFQTALLWREGVEHFWPYTCAYNNELDVAALVAINLLQQIWLLVSSMQLSKSLKKYQHFYFFHFKSSSPFSHFQLFSHFTIFVLNFTITAIYAFPSTLVITVIPILKVIQALY